MYDMLKMKKLRGMSGERYQILRGSVQARLCLEARYGYRPYDNGMYEVGASDASPSEVNL